MDQPTPFFKDRTEAGKLLGKRVAAALKNGDFFVLALPRGGVSVGYEVARILQAELDIFVVRKLGIPGQKELAIGALASSGVRILNQALIRQFDLSQPLIDRVTAREQEEVERQERLYRRGRPAPSVSGYRVILVDDGLATGASMLAAVRAVRQQQPKEIIVAVPVGSRIVCKEFKKEANQVICLETPDPFEAVGVWYDDFTQVSDAEVRKLLNRPSNWSNRESDSHVANV